MTATITASDDRTGIALTEYNLDSAGWVQYSGPFPVTGDRAHTILYRSVDGAGNREADKSASISIDATPPVNPTSVTTGTSAQSGVWQNLYQDMYFKWCCASDATSGAAFFQYYWGTNPSATDGVITPYGYYDPPAVSDGTYYLRLRTRDRAGNWSGWVTLFTLRYDGAAPTGSLNIKDGEPTTYQTYVDLKTIATDNVSGVSEMHLRDVGGDWSDWGIYEGTTWWILPQLTGQAHAVEIQYKDLAGNLSPVYTDSIYLDVYPGRPTSQNYRLEKSTFGMGATNAQSSNFQLRGTLSQESVTGFAESENYQMTAGFWSWISEIVEFFKKFLPIITK